MLTSSFGGWQTFNQAVHGNDFWQTDYDEVRRRVARDLQYLRDGHGPMRLDFRKKGGSLLENSKFDHFQVTLICVCSNSNNLGRLMPLY